jgi:hypothetical protein
VGPHTVAARLMTTTTNDGAAPVAHRDQCESAIAAKREGAEWAEGCSRGLYLQRGGLFRARSLAPRQSQYFFLSNTEESTATPALPDELNGHGVEAWWWWF